MRFALPWFLVSALSIVLYLWLRKRARADGTQLFSAGFLIPVDVRSSGAGQERRRSWETWLACVALLLLALLGAQPSVLDDGRLIITDGPLVSEQLKPEDRLVRAGISPSVESNGEKILPVDVRPNWLAASAFGRKAYPNLRQVFVPSERAVSRDLRAGMRRFGDQWGLAIQVPKGVTVEALSDSESLRLMRTVDGFEYVGLPAGRLIHLRSTDGASVVLCGHGRKKMGLKRGLLPIALERGLALHPAIELVDDGGVFELTSPSELKEPSAFALKKVHVEILQPTIEESLILRFPGVLSPPAAQVDRWSPIKNPGESLMFAGNHPMVSFQQSGDIGVLQFAFEPSHTDLTRTAGWPVLMMTIGDRLHRQFNGCVEHPAGTALVVKSKRSLRVIGPSGLSRPVISKNGVVTITGLDSAGVYSLTDGSRELDIVITANREKDDQGSIPSEVSSSVETALVPNLSLWLSLLAVLMMLSFIGRPRRWYLAATLAVLFVPVATEQLGGHARSLSLLTDVSASMDQSTSSAEAEVAESIAKASVFRADFANGIVKVGSPDGASIDALGGVDLAKTFRELHDTELRDHDLFLMSDGRFEAQEVSWHQPVYVYLKQTEGLDVRIVEAEAVEMNDGVYIHALVESNGPAVGRLVVRERIQTFRFMSAGRQSLSVRVDRNDDPMEQLEIQSDGDQELANNRLAVRVRRPLRRSALVLGQCPESMQTYLSSQYRVVDFEAEPNFSDIRITALCDTPLETIPMAILKGLPSWLERGGTLYLGGRRQAFGLGGWIGTELDTLSPLGFKPEAQGRGVIHLLVALDSSGSMSAVAGGVGMEGLRTAVPQWLSGLDAKDRVSIASFDSGIRVLMQNASAETIRRDGFPTPTESGGGTRLAPIVDWALSTIKPGVRPYLLLVSDGQFADTQQWEIQVETLRNAGVKVLSVSLGDDAEHQRLCGLSRATNGRCFKQSSRAMPRFISAAILSAQGALDVLGGAVSASEAWSIRVGGPLPSVERKVRVRLKPDARLLARQGSTPILAESAWGLGRVIAFASDRWALSGAQWRDLLSPALNDKDVDLRVSQSATDIILQGQPNMLAPSRPLQIMMGSERLAGGPWRLIRPGVFASEIPERVMGPFSLTIYAEERLHNYRFDGRVHDEWGSAERGRTVLEALASTSGGAVLTTVQEVEQLLTDRQRLGGIPLYYPLLIGGILLILLSVGRQSMGVE